MSTSNIALSILEEIEEQFTKFCKDGSSFINFDQIPESLSACGENIPTYKLRQTLDSLEITTRNQISFNDFIKIYQSLSSRPIGKDLIQLRGKKSFQETGGASCASAQDTKHSYDDDDRQAFAEWMNDVLAQDTDLKGYLPIDIESATAFFRAIKDGVVLCKLINWAVSGTIDERAINKTKLNVYTIHENLTLALNSASSIGCGLVNIGAEDIINGSPHLILGLIWQVIRIGLFTASRVKITPGLSLLLEDFETEEDLMRLTTEAIIMRWVNYHLKQANSERKIRNFRNDLKDSEVYATLLNQIRPRDVKLSLDLPENRCEADLIKRATVIIDAAKELKCRAFIKSGDIVKGNQHLNLAFLCTCFRMYPALTSVENGSECEVDEVTVVETREERTFRNWINSLGVQPTVSSLQHELQDGWVLLQVLAAVSEGSINVDGRQFNKPPFKRNGANMKRLENCNAIIRLCNEMKLSVIGIAGADIRDGNMKLTLAIIWQLMKKYTLSVLEQCHESRKPVREAEIIHWINTKLEKGGKRTRLAGFADQSVCTSVVILDLIDVLRPNSVNYTLVRPGNDDDEKLLNAKYAISLARKIGAKIYALPEDIMEMKSRMVMTVFACLMAREMLAKSKNIDI